MECNYKEVDRQLKELVIHRLNDSGMLTEIIMELTKSDENMIPTECMLTWEKGIEALRAQVAVINSLHEVRSFNTILLQKDEYKQRETKLATPVKMSARRKC